MNRTGIAAIVLSAGFSSRMERFKPLLPLGEATVLERVIRLYRSAGIEKIFCILGHRADELIPSVRKLDAQPVRNHAYTQGMFSSVLAGMDRLPIENQAFFLHPVDIPLVRRSTLGRLLAVFEKNPQAILYPTFSGKRGHPPLIPAWYIPYIKKWDGTDGIRGFLIRQEGESLEVPVADRFTHKDMDIPKDYEELTEDLNTYDFPDAEESRTLMMEILKVEDRIWNHCRAVSDIALRLGAALNESGGEVNLHLIRAAGLLHDAAKAEPEHARAAADMIQAMGFAEVADAVGQHMDVRIQKDRFPNAAEIVYLADKLVQGDQQVDLEARFDRKTAKYGHDPDTRTAIARRKSNALHIKSRIEGITGKPISAILETTTPTLHPQ